MLGLNSLLHRTLRQRLHLALVEHVPKAPGQVRRILYLELRQPAIQLCAVTATHVAFAAPGCLETRITRAVPLPQQHDPLTAGTCGQERTRLTYVFATSVVDVCTWSFDRRRIAPKRDVRYCPTVFSACPRVHSSEANRLCRCSCASIAVEILLDAHRMAFGFSSPCSCAWLKMRFTCRQARNSSVSEFTYM